ncbi:MAG: spore cortex biosynthesis protein YabQ [Bacillota bacterium]
MSLAEQVQIFLWTLAIGMLGGLCHVIYRVLSDIIKPKKLGTFAGDIVFWLFLTVVAFAILLKANYGQIRLYVFIGLFLGAFLFDRLLGKHAYSFARWMFFMLGRVFRLVGIALFYIWKGALFPFRITFIAVVFPFGLVGRLLGRAGKYTARLSGNSSVKIKAAITRIHAKIVKSLFPRG